jgi:hypothetical protein
MVSYSNTVLLAGSARTDITPPLDCLLAGFAARDHGCEGLHDNLSVTALALSRYGKRAVILGIDLIGLADEQMDEIWRRSKRQFDLEPGQLFINCSHTHAGPITRAPFNSRFCPEGKVCPPDADYIERFIESTLGTIDRALGNLQPAYANWDVGKTCIGINRRAQDVSIYSIQATGYENFPNPHKETDRACPVILVTDTGRKPIALVFGASCHPTTMRFDNYLISAEYPGVARRILEEDLDGAPSLFLQGTAGDVKPRQVAEAASFRSGTYDDIEAVGKELAADVKKTIEKGLKPLDMDIKSSLKHVSLPFDRRWNHEKYRRYAGESEPEYRRVWARHWLRKIAQGESVPETMDLTLAILELAPELRFLGIAGELLTDMSLKIKNRFHGGTTLAFGYTNGDIAYIPDAAVLKEGGYEATESVFFMEDMPAPWHENIEDIILKGFDELRETLE